MRLAAGVAARGGGRVIAAVLVVGGGERRPRRSSAAGPPGVKAEMRLDDGRGTLVVEGMAAPDGPRLPGVDEAWERRAAADRRALHADARRPRVGRGARGHDGVDMVLVSSEPRGGSERPTTAASIVFET